MKKISALILWLMAFFSSPSFAVTVNNGGFSCSCSTYAYCNASSWTHVNLNSAFAYCQTDAWIGGAVNNGNGFLILGDGTTTYQDIAVSQAGEYILNYREAEHTDGAYGKVYLRYLNSAKNVLKTTSAEFTYPFKYKSEGGTGLLSSNKTLSGGQTPSGTSYVRIEFYGTRGTNGFAKVDDISLSFTATVAKPTITINNVSENEGNSGTTNFNFTVSLSNAYTSTVTVNYATANDTGTVSDSDYQSTSGTLSFSAGQTSKTITVKVNGDTKFENDETFKVNLSGATNATISDSLGLGTIKNDDALTPPPTSTYPTCTADSSGSTTPYEIIWSAFDYTDFNVFKNTKTASSLGKKYNTFDVTMNGIHSNNPLSLSGVMFTHIGYWEQTSKKSSSNIMFTYKPTGGYWESQADDGTPVYIYPISATVNGVTTPWRAMTTYDITNPPSSFYNTAIPATANTSFKDGGTGTNYSDTETISPFPLTMPYIDTGTISTTDNKNTTYTFALEYADGRNAFVGHSDTGTRDFDWHGYMAIWYYAAPYDYGDADGYAVAGHGATLCSGALYIGDIRPDTESTTQSDGPGTASSDNTNGKLSDNNSLTPPNISKTDTSYSLSVPYHNNTGANATLAAWIDFNNNGQLEASERQKVTVSSGSGSATLNWTGISVNSSATQLVLRLRIASQDSEVTNASGLASNGEVEDYIISVNSITTPPIITEVDQTCPVGYTLDTSVNYAPNGDFSTLVGAVRNPNSWLSNNTWKTEAYYQGDNLYPRDWVSAKNTEASINSNNQILNSSYLAAYRFPGNDKYGMGMQNYLYVNGNDYGRAITSWESKSFTIDSTVPYVFVAHFSNALHSNYTAHSASNPQIQMGYNDGSWHTLGSGYSTIPRDTTSTNYSANYDKWYQFAYLINPSSSTLSLRIMDNAYQEGAWGDDLAISGIGLYKCQLPSFSVSGTIYNDVDHDGIKDSGESGMQQESYVKVCKTDNTFIKSVKTDAVTGLYNLSLPNGDYLLMEDASNSSDCSTTTDASGWISTTPNSVAVTVNGTAVTNKDFGNFHGSTISGYLFNDLDQDGHFDQDTETGMANIDLLIKRCGETEFDNTTTDADGHYTFWVPVGVQGDYAVDNWVGIFEKNSAGKISTDAGFIDDYLSTGDEFNNGVGTQSEPSNGSNTDHNWLCFHNISGLDFDNGGYQLVGNNFGNYYSRCDVIPNDEPTAALAQSQVSFDITGVGGEFGSAILNAITVNGKTKPFSELIGPDKLSYSFTYPHETSQYINYHGTYAERITDGPAIFDPALIATMNDRDLNHLFAVDPGNGTGPVIGDYVDFKYNTPIKAASDRYIVITERGGNNSVKIDALDQSGNPIAGGRTINLPANSPQYIQTGISVSTHPQYPTAKTQKLKAGVFPLTAVASRGTRVYGLRLTYNQKVDGADSKIFLIVDPTTICTIANQNDDFTPNIINALSGGTTSSVFDDNGYGVDLANNEPATNSNIDDGISIIDNGGLTGVAINTDGTLNIPAGTTAGDYNLTYKSCLTIDNSICDTAVSTVKVKNPTASISGTVFNDKNKNGTKDSNEKGIGTDTYVKICNKSDNTFVNSVKADSSTGAYTLANLNIGDYIIMEDASDSHDCTTQRDALGWISSTVNEQSVTINKINILDKDFGNYLDDDEPIGCVQTAYLYQDNPTDPYAFDLSTGEMTKLADDPFEGHVNAIGYNEVDGYIWGSHNTKKGYISRIDKNQKIKLFKVENYDGQSAITGDVSFDGKLYLRTTGTRLDTIDLNSGSPNYLKAITTPLSTNVNSADWAVNPIDNQIYAMGSNRYLYKIDPETGSVTNLGKVEIESPKTGFGGQYFDNDGYFYAYNNSDGITYQIDINKVEAKKFSQGRAVGINDGARCSHAVVPQIVVDYRFDQCHWTGATGEVVDSGSQGVHGTAQKDADTTAGKLNQAGSFDGTNYVKVNSDSLSALGDNNANFTVSFWIKLNEGATGSWRGIAHKGNNTGERTFGIWVRPNDNKIHYRITTNADYNEGGDSNQELNIGAWTHVTYVKEFNRLKLYLNGVEDSEVVLRGQSIANDGPLYIGALANGVGSKSDMDEFKIFNEALSDETIQSIYQNESNGKNYNGTERYSIICEPLTDGVCYATSTTGNLYATKLDPGAEIENLPKALKLKLDFSSIPAGKPTTLQGQASAYYGKSGQLYVFATNSDQAPHLYSINPVTGKVSYITQFESMKKEVHASAFGTDKLYVVAKSAPGKYDGSFYTIDTQTWEIEKTFKLRGASSTASGLAISQNGDAYAIVDRSNNISKLYKIDINRGVMTHQVNLPNVDGRHIGAEGLSFADDGGLYTENSDSELSTVNDIIYQINPTTGELTPAAQMPTKGDSERLDIQSLACDVAVETLVPKPNVTIEDVSQLEGDGGITEFIIPVKLDIPAPAGGVTLTYAAESDTVEEDDFPTGFAHGFFRKLKENKDKTYNHDKQLDKDEGYESDNYYHQNYLRYYDNWWVFWISWRMYQRNYTDQYTNFEEYYIKKLKKTPRDISEDDNNDNDWWSNWWDKDDDKTGSANKLTKGSTNFFKDENGDGIDDNLTLTITIDEGETEGEIIVPVKGDTSVEDNEPFKIIVESSSDAIVVDDNATAIIINDDINLTGSLVAEYRFDECEWTGAAGEVTDSGPNGLHATAMGGAELTAGVLNNAGKFDGNAYIDIPQNSQLSLTGDMSMSFWANPTDQSYSTQNSNENWQQNFIVKGLGAEFRVDFWYDGTDQCLCVMYTHGNDSNMVNPDNDKIYWNQWYHFVLVRDTTAKVVHFYVNGVLIDSKPYDSLGIGEPTSQLSGVTLASGTSASKFKGEIDEVKFFSGAMSGGQATEIYNNERDGLNYDGTVRPAIVCQEPFTCDETLYLSNRNQSGTGNTDSGKTWLHSINRSNIPYDFDAIGSGYTSSNGGYNALGYNIKDNFMYALYGKTLVKIDKNAIVKELGTVIGLPDEQLYAGEFGRDGYYYASGNGGNDNRLYKIDVSQVKVVDTITLSQSVRFWDMAIDETGNYFYVMLISDGDADSDYNNDKVAKIDISNGNITTIGESHSGEPSYISLVYSDRDGDIFMVANSDHFYKVDTVTGALYEMSSIQELTFYNDGTSCPDANMTEPVSVTHITDVEKAEGDSGTTTFRFTLYFNRPTEANSGFWVTYTDGVNAVYPIETAGHVDTHTGDEADFDGTARYIALPIGLTSYEINATVIGDTYVEHHEAFYVDIYAPNNLILMDTRAVGTIINDDTVNLRVERDNSSTIAAPTTVYDQRRKSTMYTQMVKKDFDYSVVSYEDDYYAAASDHEEFPIDDITLKVDLYDINTTIPNRKLMATHYLYFPKDAPQSRELISLLNDLKVDHATRRAQFVVSCPVDGNNSIIYGNYSANELDYNQTITDHHGSEQVGYSESFAIRPLGFNVTISDNLTPITNNHTTGGKGVNPVSLAAEYPYRLTATAVRDSSGTPETEYKTDNRWELNGALDFNGSTTNCNIQESVDLVQENTMHGVFNGGELTGDDFNHSEAGRYMFTLLDINWTHVDQNDTDPELSGCIVDANNSERIGGKYGCNISSDIENNALFDPIAIEFEPYEFNITNTFVRNANGTNRNHVYMGDLSRSLDMGVEIGGDVIAQGKNHKRLYNFVEGCAAEAVNIDLQYLITSDQNLTDSTTYNKILTRNGTPMDFNYVYAFNGNAYNAADLDERLDNNITIPSSAFVKSQEGNSSVSILYNITKDLNEPMNPVKVIFSDLNASSVDAASYSNGSDNFIPYGGAETAQLDRNGTGTRFFYYSKVAPYQENYGDVTGTSLNTPIYVAIYCGDMNQSWCSTMINSNGLSESFAQSGWYTAHLHDSSTDGSISQLSVGDPSDSVTDAASLPNFHDGRAGRIEDITTATNHGSLPWRVTVTIDQMSPWLYHHIIDDEGKPFWRVNFKGNSNGVITGVGETGHITEIDANTNYSNSKGGKIDW